MKLSFRMLGTFVFLLLIPAMVYSVPKYTDKEHALKLAKDLDKGKFGLLQISSTYVLNDSDKDFYISAILSDGSTQKWFMNQIFNWSREGQLRLSNNRVLIFPDHNSSHFEILEKKQFYQLAIKGKTYIKTFLSGDPLSGQKMYFRIKSFNLLSPKKYSIGKDMTGGRYWYILDLMNKTRDFLTYEDAYWILKNGTILSEANPAGASVIEKANHVKSISPFYGKTKNGIKQFGINILFESPIQYKDVTFPTEVFEKTLKRRKNNIQIFYLDITLPNTEYNKKVKSIKSLEYLQYIHIVKDTRYSQRVLLRAQFSPLVLDIPPVIKIAGEKKITATFFKITDQTIFKANFGKTASEEKAEKPKKKVVIPLPKETKSEYGQAYLKAVQKTNTLKDMKTKEEEWDTILASINLFEQAALKAENDQQMLETLSKRNFLRQKAVNFAISYARKNIKTKDESLKTKVLEKINHAETLTTSPKDIAKIEMLQKKLSK